MFSPTSCRTVSAFLLRARKPAAVGATVTSAGAALFFHQQGSVLHTSGFASMAEGPGAFSPKVCAESVRLSMSGTPNPCVVRGGGESIFDGVSRKNGSG